MPNEKYDALRSESRVFSLDLPLVIFPAEFNVSTIVYDNHGNPLEGAIIKIKRGEKEIQGVSNNSGGVLFSLPPGTYVAKVYTDNTEEDLIAERKIDVLSEKKYTIVTTNEPLLPFIIIGIGIIILVGVAVLSSRKKDALFFFKFLAVVLAIIAIVSPWWTINSSSSNSQLKTSTNMFLMPAEMVTITSDSNLTAGKLASLDETFASVVNVLPLVISVGFVCVIISIFLKRSERIRLSFLFFIIGLLISIGSTFVFYYSMSEFSEVTLD